jgi:hypothetical protein
MLFIAWAPVAIAFIVSRFTLAFSIAITCVSRVILDPDIFEIWSSYAFLRLRAMRATREVSDAMAE